MKQLNIKWRPNVFDLVIVLLGAAALAILYFVLKPAAVSTPDYDTITVQYTVELKSVIEGCSDYMTVGEELLDSSTNASLGIITAIDAKPSTTTVADEEAKVVRQVEIPGYEDITLTVEAEVQGYSDKLALDSGYKLLVGRSINAKTTNFVGSGYILTISR